jgi:hypothetical protein
MPVRRLILCATIALGLGGPAPQGSAQSADADNSAELAQRDIEMRILNDVLDTFWEVMDPQERAVLQEIDVRIPMDYDMTRVIAYRDEGRVIEISFGFYGLMTTLCSDWMLALHYEEQDPDIHDKYEAYIGYVNDTIDRNERAIGQERAPLLSFAEFAGIPAESAEWIKGQSDFEHYNAALKITAIAFVLAHEIGHHVLGHLDSPPASPEESRAREAAADRYASELTMRARLPAFGALPALAIFTAVEGEYVDPDATHPIASCRIITALVHTVDWLAEDPETAHLFDGDPGMRPGGARYQQLAALREQYCS